MKIPYPLTIIADRYTGVYSGGKFTAWKLEGWDLPSGIDSDDVTCAEFWSYNNIPVGLGKTPKKAIKNLIKKLGK